MNFDDFIQQQADGYVHIVEGLDGFNRPAQSIMPMTYEQMDYWKALWPLNIVGAIAPEDARVDLSVTTLGRPTGRPVRQYKFIYQGTWRTSRRDNEGRAQRSKAFLHS